MQRVITHSAAFVVAIMIAATSLTAVTSMPGDLQVAIAAAPMLA